MRKIQRILIEHKTGKIFYVKDLDEDFHTAFGTISKKELASNKTIVVSSKKRNFTMIVPGFRDYWEALQRGPQMLILKDIGSIIAKTGINKESTIVDAGGGTGSLCLSLANIAKHVTVYEINPEHYAIVHKNVQLCGMDNITLKQQNIYHGISEKELDLITLDLPEPWNVTEHAQASIKLGGFLVVYLPNMNQIKLFIDSLKGTTFSVLEVSELLERHWKIEDRIMRPEFQMLGHTGFLVFCRKY